MCDKAAQCELALTNRRGITAHFLVLDRLRVLASAFCPGILSEEGSYSRNSKVLLKMKTLFPYHICSRAERSGRSFVHPACPAIPSFLPGVPLPSTSLPGWPLSKALHTEGSRGAWMYGMVVLQMHQIQSDLNCVPGESTLQCAVLWGYRYASWLKNGKKPGDFRTKMFKAYWSPFLITT